MSKDKCVIKCTPHVNLASGYTRVRVMPGNYSSIIMIAGLTGKTIQDVVDELLTYAIKNVQVMQCNGNLTDLNLTNGENEQ